jgi:ribulose-phosphate 3-epimerase
MYSNEQVNRFSISASVISTSPVNFFKTLEELIDLGLDRIHVDIMDGHFVPRLGLYPELVANIRDCTEIPIDIHLMVSEPERYLENFARVGASRITPHIESTLHPHHLIQSIKALDVEAGIALNPGTPISALEELIHEVQSVTLMAINPGIVGHKLIPTTLQKIDKFLDFKTVHGFKGQLEIDGGVVFENIESLARSDSVILVCGAGTIYNKVTSSAKNMCTLNKLRL